MMARTQIHKSLEGGTALMAIAAPNTSTTVTAPDTGQSYGAPLATVTTLFFMWGFLTCLNDILVPHLKSIFDLNYLQSQLIQFAFFGAYFIFSLPSAKLVDWIGYQKSMVAGLLTMGVGAFLFVPAARLSFLRPGSPACRWPRILTSQYWESLRRLRAG
jgi:MFS family permease